MFMELGAAGLKEQPFRTHGKPVVFVPYAGQEDAFDFLHATYSHFSGLGLFQGPPLSGKSTIIHQFVRLKKEHCGIAVVNSAGVSPKTLLESLLRKYGYEYKFDTVNEMLNMLKVFIQQQTVAGQPPLLIVENIHAMNPGSLRVLCELAEVRVKKNFALRIVLVSDRPIDYIVESPAMECMSKRLTGDFHLEPMTLDETSDYLHIKMRQGGCLDPDLVLPRPVCDELFRASGGWPGVVDRLALLAIAKAFQSPIKIEHIEYPTIPESTRPTIVVQESSAAGRVAAAHPPPTLRLTHNGKTLREIKFDGSRLLIGRTEHNDVQIDNSFISRHHALLVRHGPATLLMDLNSANGTYVNSWRISNQVLAHDDIVTLGEHGLKFIDENARSREPLADVNLDDTAVMKTLADMRRVLVRENTEVMLETSKPQESSADNV